MLVDLPGFGHSERKDFGTENPFEIEAIWANSLVEVIQKEVKEDFWLAGHSFGCYLSAKLCMDGVLKPHGLILLDPWVNFNLKKEQIYSSKIRVSQLTMERCRKSLILFLGFDEQQSKQHFLFSNY